MDMDLVEVMEIIGGFLFFIFIILPLIIGAINSPRRRELTCAHGATRDCKLCRAEAAEQIRRGGYRQEWEKLRRAEIKRLSQARLRSSEAYFAMGPRDFENAMMKVFRRLGYRVNQTAYVGDGGKDAIAWKGKKKYVIECKRYGDRSATGRRDLQILLAAKHDVEADEAIFVSTGRFTAPAVAYARENDIQYYDRDAFPDLINRAYGETHDFTKAKTICLECGRQIYASIGSEVGEVVRAAAAETEAVWEMYSNPAGEECTTHEVRAAISTSQLKYPDLDLDAPWCKDHQVPMCRVNGYRGEFWGCPEYPQCKNRGGSAARPPEVVEAEADARREELRHAYTSMDETTRGRLRKEIEAELAQKGVQEMFTREDITALVAARYICSH